MLAIALVGRMTILMRRRPASEFAAVDDMAALDIGITAATIMAVAIFGHLGKMLGLLSRRSLGLLLVYYLVGILSAIWSARPAYTAFRAAQYATELLAVCAAVSYCVGFQSAERRVLLVCAVAMVLGICMQVRLVGVGTSLEEWHTNQYSTAGGILFCYCFGEMACEKGVRRRMLLFYAAIGLGGVVLGTSSASNIAVMCGAALAAILSRNRGIMLAVVVLAVLTVAVAEAREALQSAVFYGKSEASVQGMTGRVTLWESYIEDIRQEPLLGQGLAVGPRLSYRAATNAHNSVLAVLLGTGVVGLLVVCVAMAMLVREMVWTARLRRPGAVGCLAGLTAALVNSLSVAFIGECWMSCSLAFACIIALHALHVVPPPASGTGLAEAAGR